MESWVDVKPKFLEGKLGRGVESVLELSKEGMIVLRKFKMNRVE